MRQQIADTLTQIKILTLDNEHKRKDNEIKINHYITVFDPLITTIWMDWDGNNELDFLTCIVNLGGP